MTPVKWHDGAFISKSFSKSDRSEFYGVACLFLFATNAAVSEISCHHKATASPPFP